MFSIKKIISTPQQHNNDTTVSTHLYQDDDEPYLAEAVDSSSLSEAKEEVNLIFEGEDRYPTVLVPGLFWVDKIEFTLPGGKQWVFSDYWNDVKDIVEDPFISSPSSLSVSIKKFFSFLLSRSQAMKLFILA